MGSRNNARWRLKKIHIHNSRSLNSAETDDLDCDRVTLLILQFHHIQVITFTFNYQWFRSFWFSKHLTKKQCQSCSHFPVVVTNLPVIFFFITHLHTLICSSSTIINNRIIKIQSHITQTDMVSSHSSLSMHHFVK